MFTSIEQVLHAYKEALGAHLRRCIMVESTVKRKLPAGDYRGVVNWSKEDQKWQKIDRKRLDGMADALGLSAEEKASIDQEVAKSL